MPDMFNTSLVERSVAKSAFFRIIVIILKSLNVISYCGLRTEKQ